MSFKHLVPGKGPFRLKYTEDTKNDLLDLEIVFTVGEMIDLDFCVHFTQGVRPEV